MNTKTHTAITVSISPSHFWAEWDTATYAPNIVRRDTRIYWSPQTALVLGQCVGTFFGENPGSGRPAVAVARGGTAPIIDNARRTGDPTLRLLLEIWQQAVTSKGNPVPAPTDYLEVLNTYYFRDGRSRHALKAWQLAGGNAIYCPTVSASSEFVLVGWGVGHNSSSTAADSVGLLRPHPRVIVPDSKASVTVLSGAALAIPLAPAPVAPSYILQQSRRLKPLFVNAVAAVL